MAPRSTRPPSAVAEEIKLIDSRDRRFLGGLARRSRRCRRASQATGQCIDLGLHSLFRDCNQKAIVQFWIPPAQRKTGEKSSVLGIAQYFRDLPIPIANDKFLEIGL